MCMALACEDIAIRLLVCAETEGLGARGTIARSPIHTHSTKRNCRDDACTLSQHSHNQP